MLDEISAQLTLDDALRYLQRRGMRWNLLEHWQQGEFHHDLLLHLTPDPAAPPAPYLIIATNCNGGVKEVLAFDDPPDRWALWRWRCPDNPEFDGDLPPLRGRATTLHWFDPCALLTDDARSELRPEARQRMRGGGWCLKK